MVVTFKNFIKLFIRMKGLLIRLHEPGDQNMPSYGLASLAAAIRHKHTVEVLDCQVMRITINKILKKISEPLRSKLRGITDNKTFEFIAVSCMYQFDINKIFKLVKTIKRNSPDIISIVGGLYASYNPRTMLKNGFDYVVVGEGEVTLIELLESLESGGKIEAIKGIAYLTEDKQFIKNQERELLELDALPITKCDSNIIPNYRYIETSRGCIHNCKFCSSIVFWRHCWRKKSSERIIAEFEEAKKDGIKCISIIDDNFIGNDPDRVEKLCKYLVKHNINIKWWCSIRADFVVKCPYIIKLMKFAGCSIIFIGFESMSDRILKIYNKNTNVKTNISALNLLKKNGILVEGGFILGCTNESLIEMKKTIKFARKCDFINIGPLVSSTIKQKKQQSI